jgi:hypothetical protein
MSTAVFHDQRLLQLELPFVDADRQRNFLLLSVYVIKYV